MKSKINTLSIIVTTILLFFVTSIFSSFTLAASNPSLVFTINCVLAPKDLQDCPRVSSFSIPPGEMELRWNLFNATSDYTCKASATGNSENWSGSKPTTGSEQIFSGLPGAIKYGLTCTDDSGHSLSSSFIVNVGPTNNAPDSSASNPGSGAGSTKTGTAKVSGSFDNSNYTPSASCKINADDSFKDIVMDFFIGCIFVNVVYIIMAIAVALFLWGIYKFIMSAGGDGKEDGKQLMFWGIIGLFVMLSMWGLVAIVLGPNMNNEKYQVTPTSIDIPPFELAQ